MAQGNPIDIIVTKQALDAVDALDAKLLSVVSHVSELSTQAANASRNISGVKTPGGLASTQQSNAKTIADIQRLAAEYDKALAKQQAALERTRLAEIRLQQQREKSVDNFTKNEAKQQAALAKSETAYNRIQASVNALTQSYRDLAIRKQLGNTLSLKEEAQLSSITARLTQYQNALKKVDADMGNHQRSVGDYSSATRNLNSSIGQISRELPNFGQSFSVGVLSLTNNIGALQDAIAQTVRENKELAAQGKTTKSVFSSIAGSVLSGTTALYIAIGVFSAFSKPIGDFVTNLFKAADASSALQRSAKIITDLSKETVKSVMDENIALSANLAIAKDVSLSYNERVIAVDNLQKQYPFYFENLTKEQILAGDTAAAEYKLRDAILARAKATAAVAKITENQTAIIDLEEKRLKLMDELQKRQSYAASQQRLAEQSLKTTTQSEGALNRYNSAAADVLATKEAITRIDKEIAKYDVINNRLTSYQIEQAKISIGLDGESAKTKEESAKEQEAFQTNSNKAFDETISNLEKQAESIDKTTDSYKFLINTIGLLKTIQENIGKEGIELPGFVRGNEEFEDPFKKIDDGSEAVKKIKKDFEEWNKQLEQTNKHLSGFTDKMFNDAGLGSMKQFFDGTFKALMDGAQGSKQEFAIAFNAIADSAQEAFSFIAQASESNFNREYERLEMQKEIALKFAGESASAKEAIEKQSDDRRRAIQRREAEANKKLALLNIAINTAQGIVSALAMLPPNIPLSIAIGVIGSVQAATVASQEIPQFWKGGTHDGGLMMVNDGGGANYREKIVTPSGDILSPQGKNVIMNAPKGTEIFTHDQWNKKMTDDLAREGILMPSRNIMSFGNKSNGISEGQMDVIMGKYFGRIQTNVVTFDKNGINFHTASQMNKTIKTNNRASAKGYSV